jgi:hypothetical protein
MRLGNRLATLSAGWTFNQSICPSAAQSLRESPPPSVGRRKQRYILVAHPARLPQVRLISALAPARLSRDLLELIPPPLRSGGLPLSILGKSADRQGARKTKSRVGRLTLSVAL